MSLWQALYKTYVNNQNRAGVYEEGKEPLAPISHIVTKCEIEITVDSDGKFIQAVSVDKEHQLTIIPVTQDSAGRSSGIAAHPLCEQLQYLSPKDAKKYEAYTAQLEDWCDSAYTHPKLKPILRYVQRGTIENDLIAASIKYKKKDKPRIRWIVTGIGEFSGPCWTDRSLFDAYIQYYASVIQQKDSRGIDMVSGENDVLAEQHLKGTVSSSGNAKLISANDSSGFTYRGRFILSTEANTIGYRSSQMIHNALKWLASNQGVSQNYGKRLFLCWSPDGIEIPSALGPFAKKEDRNSKRVMPSDYKEKLWQTLQGWKNNLPQNSGTVISTFDAATPGRLSVTYYQELLTSDFLQRLYDWDNSCCWWSYGEVVSPSLYQIVSSAYGTQRTVMNKEILVTEDKVLRSQMQVLLSSRVEKAPIPHVLIKKLIEQASCPQNYNSSNREYILTAVCAVLKKDKFDSTKEELSMALEPEKNDRSYQFGRLLAVYEKMETDTYTDNDNTRLSNAIRLQSVYCKQPLHYARILEEQINRAYLGQLNPGSRIWYKNIIDQIMSVLSKFPDEQLDRPLTDSYLIGYYLQRNEFYQSHKKTSKEDQ